MAAGETLKSVASFSIPPPPLLLMDSSENSFQKDDMLQLLRTQVGESFVAVSRGFNEHTEVSGDGWCVFSGQPLINGNRFLIQRDSLNTLQRYESQLEEFGCSSTGMFAGEAQRLPLSTKWTQSHSTSFMTYDLTTLSEATIDVMHDSRVYMAKSSDYERVVECLIGSFDMDPQSVACSPFAHAARTIDSMKDVKIFLIDDGDVVASIVYSVKVGQNVSLLAMGTVPSSRRKGLAKAILHASFIDAHSQGLQKVLLFASKLGKYLYDSIGFKTLEEWTFFSYNPKTSAP